MDNNTKDVLLALVAAIAPIIGGYMAFRWHITVKTISAENKGKPVPSDEGNAGPMGKRG